MIVFVASNGPFDDPPSGYVKTGKFHKDGTEITITVIAKWHDGKWWAGKHEEKTCPVCMGLGVDPNYKEPELKQRELDIPELKVEKKVYTDV